MIFLIYDISSFNNVWSLQINFALLNRVLIVDNFKCSGWFDEKWVYWPVWKQKNKLKNTNEKLEEVLSVNDYIDHEMKTRKNTG